MEALGEGGPGGEKVAGRTTFVTGVTVAAKQPQMTGTLDTVEKEATGRQASGSFLTLEIQGRIGLNQGLNTLRRRTPSPAVAGCQTTGQIRLCEGAPLRRKGGPRGTGPRIQARLAGRRKGEVQSLETLAMPLKQGTQPVEASHPGLQRLRRILVRLSQHDHRQARQGRACHRVARCAVIHSLQDAKHATK